MMSGTRPRWRSSMVVPLGAVEPGTDLASLSCRGSSVMGALQMRLVLGGGERGRHCGREAAHLLGSWPSPADVHRAASVVELAFAGELAIDHGPNQGAAPVGGNLSGSEARCRVDDDRYERHPDAGGRDPCRAGTFVHVDAVALQHGNRVAVDMEGSSPTGLGRLDLSGRADCGVDRDLLLLQGDRRAGNGDQLAPSSPSDRAENEKGSDFRRHFDRGSKKQGQLFDFRWSALFGSVGAGGHLEVDHRISQSFGPAKEWNIEALGLVEPGGAQPRLAHLTEQVVHDGTLDAFHGPGSDGGGEPSLVQIAIVPNGLVGPALLFGQVLREKALDRLIHREVPVVACIRELRPAQLVDQGDQLGCGLRLSVRRDGAVESPWPAVLPATDGHTQLPSSRPDEAHRACPFAGPGAVRWVDFCNTFKS